VSSSCEVLHHEVKFPFPLSNRDYVYYRRSLVDPGQHFTYVGLNPPPSHFSKPRISDAVSTSLPIYLTSSLFSLSFSSLVYALFFSLFLPPFA
jgi:hypothetical protein